MIINDTKFNIRAIYNPLGSTKIANTLRSGHIDKNKLLIGDEEHSTYDCEGEQSTYARSKRRKASMMNDTTSCISEIGADNQKWTDFWTDPSKAYEVCKKQNKDAPHELRCMRDWVSHTDVKMTHNYLFKTYLRPEVLQSIKNRTRIIPAHIDF